MASSPTLSRGAALGDPAADVAAGAEPLAVVFHFCRLASGGAGNGGRHSAGAGAGRRVGRDAGVDRPAGAGRACCWWPSTSWRRSSQTKGPLYVSLWYFMAAFVWTFLTYAMGNFMPEYFVGGHQCRGDRRPVHSRSGRPVRDAARLGTDVLLRSDPAQEADLEPRPVARRLLGPGVLLSAQRHPPLSCTRRFPCSCNTGRSSPRSPSSSW